MAQRTRTLFALPETWPWGNPNVVYTIPCHMLKPGVCHARASWSTRRPPHTSRRSRKTWQTAIPPRRRKTSDKGSLSPGGCKWPLATTVTPRRVLCDHTACPQAQVTPTQPNNMSTAKCPTHHSNRGSHLRATQGYMCVQTGVNLTDAGMAELSTDRHSHLFSRRLRRGASQR